jgi:hypothetical protein
MIDWRVEITEGRWLRLMWNDDTETIRLEWEDGKPPPDMKTPAAERRLNEALEALRQNILIEKITKLLGDDHESIH